MTSDQSPEPARSVQSHERATSRAQLRRRLRVRLEHHLAIDALEPALTIVGFDGESSTVLDRGQDHPEDIMLGFVLPSQFSAIGVLASSVVSTEPARRHRDAALALGVTREGDVASLLATPESVIDTKEPKGWMIDACLRSVGRETPACTVASLALPTALWLDRLMVAVLNVSRTEPVTWSDAVDLCPIPRRWRSVDPIDLGTTLGSTTRSWSALRGDAARGEPTLTGLSPAHAAWMDDAMFARWSLGSFPDLANLRGDVEFLAPEQVAQGVEIALRAAWLAFAD